MIQSEEIIIVKKYNYDIAHILIQKTPNGLKAEVQLSVTDENGVFVESLVTSYENEEYNTWWGNFNSWKDVLTPILEPKKIIIPETIEEEFVNEINTIENEN